jgi:hypothetical protein
MSNEFQERVDSACNLFRDVYGNNPDNLQKAIKELRDFSINGGNGDGKLFSIMILTLELKMSLAAAMTAVETSDAWN